MDKLGIKDVAKKMAKLDLCMMITHDGRGTTHSRPMSNNGKVEYDGNSWFFTYEDSAKVAQIKKTNRVTLIFQAEKALFIEVCGDGKIVTDKDKMKDLWYDDLTMWFKEGLETPGIALIQVVADHVHIWDKDKEGTYTT